MTLVGLRSSLLLLLLLVSGCGDDSGNAGGSTGSGSGGSDAPAIREEGMYGRANCHGQIVEAQCSPGEFHIDAVTTYFFLQCYDATARFEVWVYEPVAGDLSATRSEVYFVCPGDSVTSPLKVEASEGPGVMTVDDLEVGEFITGEFASPSIELEGWFNAKDDD